MPYTISSHQRRIGLGGFFSVALFSVATALSASSAAAAPGSKHAGSHVAPHIAPYAATYVAPRAVNADAIAQARRSSDGAAFQPAAVRRGARHYAGRKFYGRPYARGFHKRAYGAPYYYGARRGIHPHRGFHAGHGVHPGHGFGTHGKGVHGKGARGKIVVSPHGRAFVGKGLAPSRHGRPTKTIKKVY